MSVEGVKADYAQRKVHVVLVRGLFELGICLFRLSYPLWLKRVSPSWPHTENHFK